MPIFICLFKILFNCAIKIEFIISLTLQIIFNYINMWFICSKLPNPSSGRTTYIYPYIFKCTFWYT